MRKKIKIAIICGARPNFMKVAPLCYELEKQKIDFFVINTGQHFSREMAKIFFDDFEIKTKYDLNQSYFLYVGDINYNKNLPGLLEIFAKMPADCLLVLVSRTLRRDNPVAAFLWQQIDKLGIEKQLRVLNNVGNNEMCSLYSGALWYVQPSLYEGFGLPILEAQACECPVISTTGGSLKEICADSCLNYDLLLKSTDIDRDPFIEKGRHNQRRFSWEKTVNNMKEVYETVA